MATQEDPVKLRVIALSLLLLAAPAHADDVITDLDVLLQNFGWDLDATEITSETVAQGLHVLFGAGGNIAVSIGDDGVLIVDDQFPALQQKIERAIGGLGGGRVDFAINTHWHFDHAEGNLGFGPAGTILIAQSESGEKMATGGLVNLVTARYQQPAYPENARPTVTYDEQMKLHFNGGEIELLHDGPAHTAGDTAVFFRAHNAVHLGDVFNNSGYPFIDADSGGGIDGMISFCKAVLAELRPDAIVIPGHGPVTDDAALRRYIEMLETVRGRVAKLIADGKTLKEAVAAKPTADLDAVYGPESESLGFVNRVYTSLTRDQ